MSEAIFGLVGVFVGGLITAGTQGLRDRFVRRRERNTAARLISSEMGDAGAAIEFATEFKAWWPNDLQRRDWDRYVAVLTAELSMKEWLVVLEAHDAIARMLRTRDASGGALAALPPAALADLEVEKARIGKAIDWLAPHSYNFGWWKVQHRFGLWRAKRELHRDGPDVPS